ncbi:MAG: deoxyribose-phosphate aldolase [Gammaproteobacteria bacterium RIFCSPHIGHO2_12_FULL_35_23]|nr:MAG: deoxyribose-phosphate aldolase [Gammaproteobacteria bacterium RIFCSPHIGHO2_12_FULL_35_23]
MFSNELIVSLLDLTSLTGQETKTDILSVCQQAQTPYGKVAAVCLYPTHLLLAKQLLFNTSIKLATVINFPHGKSLLAESLATIELAIEHQADEIDLVMPYYLLFEKNYHAIETYLQKCREACPTHCLKVIIESGALMPEQIKIACQLVIQIKANFIKTSTGKISQGASLAAADIILQTIQASQSNIGLKISGGIRTKEQTRDYLNLAVTYFGKVWLQPTHFRIGCSRLLV